MIAEEPVFILDGVILVKLHSSSSRGTTSYLTDVNDESIPVFSCMVLLALRPTLKRSADIFSEIFREDLIAKYEKA